MPKTFYITTPLYYVNAKPHIGHAYTNVLCDTFARFHKLRGEKVFFLTGTDEHGAKIEKAARDAGMEPRAYVDSMVPQFKDLWKLLGIEYDHFIRTTDEDHKKVVAKVLQDLEKKGEIYKASYKGWYCTPCESFWTASQLNVGAGSPRPGQSQGEGTSPLHKHKCPDCGRDVQELSEENYFFKLLKHQTWLIEEIQSGRLKIIPEIRKNEILGFLREPLEDLSITRPRARLAWGIDYPSSADHVVYVWFDALINYITGAGFSLNEEKFKELWPADCHMVGKDILRQHTVYWPLMLRSIGVEMPRTVVAHGWWTMAGAKVSKSRGNAVDPVELCQKYGVGAFRYYLLREVTLGLDGAFSEDLLAERYTSDLANDLGNLWFRFASMLEKYFESKIPKPNGGAGSPLQQKSYELWSHVESAMLAYEPREALNKMWEVVTLANQFVEEKKPWALAKDPAKKSELEAAMVTLGETAAHLAVALLPFMPQTAKQILSRLKLPTDWVIKDEMDYKRPFLKPGAAIEKGAVLFPRLDQN